MTLERLLAERTDLWRGRTISPAAAPGVPSGFAALDRALPWGGWPPGLSEVLSERPGAALALLLPMLVARGALGTAGAPGWLLLVNPPLIPYAPALAAHGLDLRRLLTVEAPGQGAWVVEQGLGTGACAGVLCWAEAAAAGIAAGSEDSGRVGRDLGTGAGRRRDAHAGHWPTSALRRLQLAAAENAAPAVLLRPPSAAGTASPAMLRLALETAPDGLAVTLLKVRGGRAGLRLALAAPASVQRRPQTPIGR